MLNILHSVLPLCYKKEYYTFAKTSQMRFRMTYFRESLHGNGNQLNSVCGYFIPFLVAKKFPKIFTIKLYRYVIKHCLRFLFLFGWCDFFVYLILVMSFKHGVFINLK